MKADGFPVLNALKEVHLILSQGAHNQFGDLPSTARIEMLMQQWLLARPEFREFLPTRIMVAYPEPWMDRVDAMKKLQGWTDTSVLHFRNLAMFGEQILLSIRYGNWSDVSDPVQAPTGRASGGREIQGYIHAYRAVTGVDLTARDVSGEGRRDAALGAAAASAWRPSAAAPEARADARLHVRPLSRAAAPERVAPPLGRAHARAAGRPEEPPDAEAVAGELARLQGSEAATLLPSTLASVLGSVPRARSQADRRSCAMPSLYPIARWGVERAAALGTPVHAFAHHDAAALARIVDRLARAKLRPIIVADGYCPSCGAPAPIRAYAEMARRAGGYLVLDDTQALGILGESPTRANPYGTGGGGSLRWHGVFGPHIIVGSSLAKGFGAPLAALSGSRALIDRFRERSETRLHSSPPSVAAIHAAQRALRLNRRHGETLRRRLLDLVRRLRHRLIAAGLTPVARLPFPVQSFRAERSPPVAHVLRWLLRHGVRALLTKGCRAVAARLTFLVTARHGLADIDVAGQAAASTARSIAGADGVLVPAR